MKRGQDTGNHSPQLYRGLRHRRCGGRETRKTEDPSDRVKRVTRNNERADDRESQDADPRKWVRSSAAIPRLPGWACEMTRLASGPHATVRATLLQAISNARPRENIRITELQQVRLRSRRQQVA